MAITDIDDANYTGELFLIGANQTPLLNMIGGLTGGKNTNGFLFPMAQPWALSGASQDVQSEATAAAIGTPTTVTRNQDTNTCQIMKYDVGSTFMKQSSTGVISGVTIGNQPVDNEFEFQKSAGLRQLAINIEFSFFQGTYVAPSVSATAQATRGLEDGITTNEVAAGGADLSKALIDEALRTMSGNGSQFVNTVMFCNGFQKQQVSDIYGFAPEDRNVGGVNIKQVETDFAMMGIVWAPQMPTDDVYIVDVSVVSPVFVPVNGLQVFFTDMGSIAAQKSGFWYTQIGLDVGPEEYHGSVTGLSTS